MKQLLDSYAQYSNQKSIQHYPIEAKIENRLIRKPMSNTILS